MNEARRTLGCWLLAAFLGRGCDPTTARLPVAVARVRPLTPGEAAALACRGGNLRVLPRPRPQSWRGSGATSPSTRREPSGGSGEPTGSGAASEAATILPFRSFRPLPPTPPVPSGERAC